MRADTFLSFRCKCFSYLQLSFARRDMKCSVSSTANAADMGARISGLCATEQRPEAAEGQGRITQLL